MFLLASDLDGLNRRNLLDKISTSKAVALQSTPTKDVTVEEIFPPVNRRVTTRVLNELFWSPANVAGNFLKLPANQNFH